MLKIAPVQPEREVMQQALTSCSMSRLQVSLSSTIGPFLGNFLHLEIIDHGVKCLSDMAPVGPAECSLSKAFLRNASSGPRNERV
jgi:hypothetical protein